MVARPPPPDSSGPGLERRGRCGTPPGEKTLDGRLSPRTLARLRRSWERGWPSGALQPLRAQRALGGCTPVRVCGGGWSGARAHSVGALWCPRPPPGRDRHPRTISTTPAGARDAAHRVAGEQPWRERAGLTRPPADALAPSLRGLELLSLKQTLACVRGPGPLLDTATSGLQAAGDTQKLSQGTVGQGRGQDAPRAPSRRPQGFVAQWPESRLPGSRDQHWALRLGHGHQAWVLPGAGVAWAAVAGRPGYAGRPSGGTDKNRKARAHTVAGQAELAFPGPACWLLTGHPWAPGQVQRRRGRLREELC